MRLTSVRSICAGLIFVLSIAAQTVEPEMTADRPGFRNSTHLVGPGVVQIENGFNLGTHRTLTVQPEIRIGALSWLELRLFADTIVLRSSPAAGIAGASDLQPGIKFPVFNLLEGTRVVAILKSTVPSGHSSQSTRGYEPGAELIWEHEITDDFSFAGTWNLTRLKQEQFVWQRAASLSSNVTFGKSVRTFAEVYVVSPVELGGGNQWTVDAGIMRPIGDFLMLDAAAGRSIHGPRDWFVTVGFSVRSRVPGFHPARASRSGARF